MIYSYKCLKDISYAEIKDCFNLAFSDYALPVQLTEEQFRTYLSNSGVDKGLSYGAFSEDKMIGFILNSCCIYNGEEAVFDAGTGVIPEHRGKRVFTSLFLFAQQELLKHGVKKYYLEVLQNNHNAIHAYEKQGFIPLRGLYVLKLSVNGKNAVDSATEYIGLEQFDFSKANHCLLVQPSFEHCTNILIRTPSLYHVSYRKNDKGIAAFCVFSNENGNVMQLGYTDINELKKLFNG